jgi:YidC/Oxa1 family membrane protein insertase
MERRILLALALSFLLITLTRPLWEPRRPEPPPAEKRSTEKEHQIQPQQQQVPSMTGTVPKIPVEGKAAEAESLTEIEGDLYRIWVSNKEAVVQSWVLKKYNDSHGKPLEFVEEKKSQLFGYPLSVKIDREEELTKSLKTALFATESPSRINLSDQGKTSQDLLFEYGDQNLRVSKKLTFTRGSYVISVECGVWVNSKPVDFSLNWSSGFGDSSIDPRMAVHRCLYRTESAIKRLKSSDITGEQELSGSFDFAGLEDLYFAALFLPAQGTSLKRFQLAQNEYDLGNGAKEQLLRVGVFGNAHEKQGVRLFVGPKDTEVLKITGSNLVEVIDYGWFAVVCEPLLLALKWIYSYVRNYGVAIVILTLLINVALFPLKYKSIVSAQKMQKLQPQMKAIQEKFKKLKPTDPKRQQMNAEVMALYKQHGVNPLGGCLPLLLQMPFFIAFYNLLSVAIELRHAPFVLWIKDLSAADHTYILPILMTVSMVIMQKMTPTPTADPVQAKIMLAMPVFFGFMLAFTSSGLVLYWLTSNITGIAQQYLMNKYGPRVAAETPAKRPKKK